MCALELSPVKLCLPQLSSCSINRCLECLLELDPVELCLPQLTFCPLNRCLECALELYPVELCLPQLARSLDTVKAAKGRTALLEVFTANCGQAVTTATALPALR